VLTACSPFLCEKCMSSVKKRLVLSAAKVLQIIKKWHC
jgi:hypothetical protein